MDFNQSSASQFHLIATKPNYTPVHSKRSISVVCLLAGGCAQVRSDTWRASVDNQGRQIEAEFVIQDATNVVLKLPGNGKPVSVPLITLSEADREFLRARAAEANAPVAATGKYAAQRTGAFEPGNFEGTLCYLIDQTPTGIVSH